MKDNLDILFNDIRNSIFSLIQEKMVNINALAFDLGMTKEDFMNNMFKRNNDFTFYLQTLSLLENWEG